VKALQKLRKPSLRISDSKIRPAPADACSTELELTKAKEKKELASQGTGSEELEQIHQELQLTGTRLELKFVAEPTATRKSGKKPSHRASQRKPKRSRRESGRATASERESWAALRSGGNLLR
jgi:carbohydrate-selective porin OprB